MHDDKLTGVMVRSSASIVAAVIGDMVPSLHQYTGAALQSTLGRSLAALANPDRTNPFRSVYLFRLTRLHTVSSVHTRRMFNHCVVSLELENLQRLAHVVRHIRWCIVILRST